ncbi:putative RNA polymerase II subunit B1 CTD phosphatase RPAP2 isoform X2 [Acanthaster planci]|nr:putative RNA polymerase II subunit B1 CTD phosphatase RPAP2 isoform X2 [Acanthaster planci]
MRLASEKKAHEIVERLLDNPVTEDFLLCCAFSIYPQHYKDVVTERSIIKQCGYPLCQRSLDNVPKQKYHISCKTNKVYDITDRKCFCSQFCYKASKYFEAQLSDSPLWTREMEEPLDIKLLTQDMEADSTASYLIAKDNVVLTERIHSQDVGEVDSSDKDEPLKNEIVGLLEDDLSNLTFADTRKRERLQELAEIGRNPTTPQSEQRRSVQCKDSDNYPKQEFGSLEVQDTTSPPEDNIHGCCSGEIYEKSEAIEEQQIKNAQFNRYKSAEDSEQDYLASIDGSNSDITTGCVALGINKPSPSPDQGDASGDVQAVKKKKAKRKMKESSPQVMDETSLFQSVSRTVMEWTSNETREFLMGGSSRQCAPSQQAGVNLEMQNLTSDPVTMTRDPSADPTEPSLPPAKPLPGMDKLKEETKQYSLKVQEFYCSSYLDIKEKKKKAQNEEKQEEGVDRTLRFPLVDSKSQMAIRRKILSDRLNRVFSEMLTPLGLSMRDMSSDLQALIRTFHLSSTNITFKPAGWTMLSVLLLQILSKRNAFVEDSITKDDCQRFLDSLLFKMGTSLEQLTLWVGETFSHDGTS